MHPNKKYLYMFWSLPSLLANKSAINTKQLDSDPRKYIPTRHNIPYDTKICRTTSIYSPFYTPINTVSIKSTAQVLHAWINETRWNVKLFGINRTLTLLHYFHVTQKWKNPKPVLIYLYWKTKGKQKENLLDSIFSFLYDIPFTETYQQMQIVLKNANLCYQPTRHKINISSKSSNCSVR